MVSEPCHSALRKWREWATFLVVLAPLAVILAAEPIRQDPHYHAFADTRTWIGIPNFLNVASNIPFFLVGAAWLFLSLRSAKPGISRSWAVLFLGTALVCVGSAYYHWNPSNETLVWDRLPMTLGFMGLFVALLGEHFGRRLEHMLLVPAVLVGITSVIWWSYTDDLRFYYWVQFSPLLAIPFVLAVFPGRFTHRRYLLYGLAAYVLAKLAEAYDHEIFAVTSQTVSGHSLKHMLAALGLFYIAVMLRLRRSLA